MEGNSAMEQHSWLGVKVIGRHLFSPNHPEAIDASTVIGIAPSYTRIVSRAQVDIYMVRHGPSPSGARRLHYKIGLLKISGMTANPSKWNVKIPDDLTIAVRSLPSKKS